MATKRKMRCITGLKRGRKRRCLFSSDTGTGGEHDLDDSEEGLTSDSLVVPPIFLNESRPSPDCTHPVTGDDHCY
jgi:hypothetical protein